MRSKGKVFRKRGLFPDEKMDTGRQDKQLGFRRHGINPSFRLACRNARVILRYAAEKFPPKKHAESCWKLRKRIKGLLRNNISRQKAVFIARDQHVYEAVRRNICGKNHRHIVV